MYVGNAPYLSVAGIYYPLDHIAERVLHYEEEKDG